MLCFIIDERLAGEFTQRR